jgi:glycosyltransferase involved in cell wall biosynthesis
MQAKGEYIAFLDDDDLWSPDKLKKQLELFKMSPGSKRGLVGCGFHYQVEGEIVDTQIPLQSKVPFEDLLLGNWIGGTSLPLIKKDVLEKVGNFDVYFQSCQDWDMWLRISREFDVGIVQEPLVTRVIHPVQISGDLERKIEGRKRLLCNYNDSLKVHPLAQTVHLRRLGTLELLFKNKNAACDYFYRALKVTRTDWRSWAGLILTVLPSSLRQRILVTFAVDRIGNYILYY